MSCGIRNGTFSQRGDLVFFTDRQSGIVGGAHVRRSLRVAQREAYEDCRRKVVQEKFNAQLAEWSVCPKPAPSVPAIWLRAA